MQDSHSCTTSQSLIIPACTLHHACSRSSVWRFPVSKGRPWACNAPGLFSVYPLESRDTVSQDSKILTGISHKRAPQAETDWGRWTMLRTGKTTTGNTDHYYRKAHLSWLENLCCPGFPTENARPGQKGSFCPGSGNRDKKDPFVPVGGPFFFPVFLFSILFRFQLYFCISIKLMYWNSVCMISTNIYIYIYSYLYNMYIHIYTCEFLYIWKCLGPILYKYIYIHIYIIGVLIYIIHTYSIIFA